MFCCQRVQSYSNVSGVLDKGIDLHLFMDESTQSINHRKFKYLTHIWVYPSLQCIMCSYSIKEKV